MLDDFEPEGPAEIVEVDIRAWVETARANPMLHRNRQVTEIVLATIGLTPSLATTLVLKGGALMALAFKSERVTGDVDFSASIGPADFDKMLVEEALALVPLNVGLGDSFEGVGGADPGRMFVSTLFLTGIDSLREQFAGLVAPIACVFETDIRKCAEAKLLLDPLRVALVINPSNPVLEAPEDAS